MKTRVLVSILILSLSVLIIAGSCATSGKSYKRDFKNDMVGTWANPDYNETRFTRAKQIIKPDFTMEKYRYESSINYSLSRITITDRWSDSQGNVYYKVQTTAPAKFEYELWKLSNSATVWELVWNYSEYPSEINPNDLNYCIYYRQ